MKFDWTISAGTMVHLIVLITVIVWGHRKVFKLVRAVETKLDHMIKELNLRPK